MIKLYGTRNSRAFRCLWALEEYGTPYELVPVDWQTGETKTSEFLAINPNGHVPVFQDGDLILVESLAINLHIAHTHSSPLSPTSSLEQTKAIEWTIWAMGELEGPHDAANQSNSDVDNDLRTRAMAILDNQLDQGTYLISDRFTVADLNIASVLMRPKYMPHLSNFDRLQNWFSQCASRPALAKAIAG